MSQLNYSDNGNLPPGWEERPRLVTFNVKPDAFYEHLRQEREEERKRRHELNKIAFQNNYYQDR